MENEIFEKEQEQKNEEKEEKEIKEETKEEIGKKEENPKKKVPLKVRLEQIFKAAPKAAKIILSIALGSLLIYVAALIFPAFADFFNENIAAYVRLFMAKLTSFTRLSIAEMIIFMLPFIIACFTAASVIISKHGSDEVFVRFFSMTFAVLGLFFTLYVFTYGTGYRGSTIDEKLSLDRREVSTEELKETAQYLADRMNELSEQIPYEYKGFSVMPYDFAELNGKLNEAYSKAAQKYDFVLGFRSKLKCVGASEGMSYMHVLGMYTYYTGEANINLIWPDYSLPFTCAHEMSHQRGISREDEANFMAYLVCLESDDPYILYSAYFNVFEYVANSLYEADPDAYADVINTLSAKIRNEMVAYNRFFNTYRDSTVAVVNDKINDVNLKVNGQKEGSRSYDLVTDLAVAYILHGEAEPEE